MRKLFLDANLLIYLNTITGDERGPVDRFFKSLLTHQFFTNLLVLDETLYVSRRRYTIPYALTMNFLKVTVLPFAEIIPIAEEDLQATERHLAEYDIKPSDAIHLATMEKAGITSIVSEDDEFDSLKGIEDLELSRYHVGEIAAKERMTFYDASYVSVARIGKLTLVTEDEQLAKVASKYTKTAATRVIRSS